MLAKPSKEALRTSLHFGKHDGRKRLPSMRVSVPIAKKCSTRALKAAAREAEYMSSLCAESETIHAITKKLKKAPTRVFRTVKAAGSPDPVQVRRGRSPLLSDEHTKRVFEWVTHGVRSIATLKDRVEQVLHYENGNESMIRRLVKSVRVPRPAEHLVSKNQRRAALKKRLFEFLRSIRSTMDICVHLVTSKRLAAELVDLLQRKANPVKLRIVTDGAWAEDTRSKIAVLEKAFCIIDRSIRQNGPLNYSGRGLHKNIENAEVHFREKDELHTSSQKEFDELFNWDIFSLDGE